jgi:hypothetical protein
MFAVGEDVREILTSLARSFEVEGELVDAARVKTGHIHDTYIAAYRGRGGLFRLVHQRLNEHVFRDLDALMENMVRVTTHLRGKLLERRVPDLERRCLRLLFARDGDPLYVDHEGRSWRTSSAIEGARTVDRVERPREAYEAARAFGEFTALLDDLRTPPLAVTIPHFHDLGRRYAALEGAAREDRLRRGKGARAELASAARGFGRVTEALARGGVSDLPRRVVHHDCKVNNVMLDERSGEALCVIDLDTVMEGSVLSDFGELARTASCRAPEDERDLERIRVEPELFEAIARGYLAGADGLLEPSELRLLPLGGPLFALMNAIRFLTDHLEGDVYFRIHRESHNLERARAQLRLFERMMEAQPRFAEIVDAGAAKSGGSPAQRNA